MPMKTSLRRLNRIMKPAKFWIDGTTYNIGKKTENVQKFETISQDGKYSTTFRLPMLYYDKIHRDPKFNLSTIRQSKSQSTEILLPKEGSTGNVTISGDTLNEVQDTREEFQSMVQTIRQNIQPRQFIAIPTLSDEIKTNYGRFMQELLNREAKDKIKDLEESVFQKPEKLHITLCVLALLDEVEIDEAKRLLEAVKTDVVLPFFAGKPNVRIHLKGLSCMDSDVKKVNVLYANASIVDETEDFSLQIVADKIADYFYEKGFMKEDNKGKVKVHVTLINTKYRKNKTNKSNKNKGKWPKRIPIDASSIIKDYESFDFGTCPFDSVHLSLMSKSIQTPTEPTETGNCQGDNAFIGFYTPLSIVKL